MVCFSRVLDWGTGGGRAFTFLFFPRAHLSRLVSPEVESVLEGERAQGSGSPYDKDTVTKKTTTRRRRKERERR